MARYGWAQTETRQLITTERDISLVELAREIAPTAVVTMKEVSRGGFMLYEWSRMQNRDEEFAWRLFLLLCETGWKPLRVHSGLPDAGTTSRMFCELRKRFDN